MTTVLITDYAWPDVEVERAIIERAGFRLVAGPSTQASPAEIEALVAEHRPSAIMTNWAIVTAKAINTPPELTIVTRLGVGLDNIAVEAATARGAWVSNVPDYCVEEVSDHAVGLLLAWARGIVGFDRAVKRGEWDPASARLRRVGTLTVGLLGYGRIGRRAAEKLKPWGARLLAFRRSAAPDDDLVAFRPLEELLGASDVVIITLPLTAETSHLLDRRRLALIRPGGFLINVSRGGVVDTAALERALDEGVLAGAGLDVVEGEPTPRRSLVERPNVIITPHIAFSSASSIEELRISASNDVVTALKGGVPRCPCNRPAGRGPA